MAESKLLALLAESVGGKHGPPADFLDTIQRRRGNQVAESTSELDGKVVVRDRRGGDELRSTGDRIGFGPSEPSRPRCSSRRPSKLLATHGIERRRGGNELGALLATPLLR
jgi:hypothetical protein